MKRLRTAMSTLKLTREELLSMSIQLPTTLALSQLTITRLLQGIPSPTSCCNSVAYAERAGAAQQGPTPCTDTVNLAITWKCE